MWRFYRHTHLFWFACAQRLGGRSGDGVYKSDYDLLVVVENEQQVNDLAV